jgi:hypothetical protein
MRKPTTEDIDRRAERLIGEWQDHLKEFYTGVRERNPELLNADGSLDERRVFEGWCIQKIAWLQILGEYLLNPENWDKEETRSLW